MTLPVTLTRSANRDLQDIGDWIAQNDSPTNAIKVLNHLERVIQSLCAQPERGNIPDELATLGIKQYRQVFYKPYRIIYRVTESGIVVYVIADGRRDMQSLLSRRLLLS